MTTLLPILFAIGLFVAAVWQCSPVKQQCLNRGHVHPDLAPGGVAADAGALRFGVVHGAWCVASCWALMLLPLLATHAHLAAMACATLWMAAERLERPAEREWRVRVPQKAVRLVYGRLYTRFALTIPSRSAMRWASRKPELNAPSM